MNNWFVIRADGDAQIGLGHIMRCLAFAEWAHEKGFNAVLLCTKLPRSMSDMLKQKNIIVIELSHESNYNQKSPKTNHYAHSKWLAIDEGVDAFLCSHVIQELTAKYKKTPSFIVVDHYALGAPWESEFNQSIPVLSVDDLSDRQHNCTWLVDQTFGKQAKDYANFVNSDCIMFIGAEYALLRTEFYNIKKVFERFPPATNNKLKVLITLGGVDLDNVTGQLLSLLSETTLVDQLELTIVAGGANPHVVNLKIQCAELPCEAKLIVNTNEMALLIANHDVAIGAAGSTSWERCALSLPSLTVVLAENQKTIAKNLDLVGASINLGHIEDITSSNLERELKSIYLDIEKYESMMMKSEQVCDGLGVKRVLDKILETIEC